MSVTICPRFYGTVIGNMMVHQISCNLLTFSSQRAKSGANADIGSPQEISAYSMVMLNLNIRNIVNDVHSVSHYNVLEDIWTA